MLRSHPDNIEKFEIITRLKLLILIFLQHDISVRSSSLFEIYQRNRSWGEKSVPF